MNGLPLDIRALVVDELDQLADVKSLSLCSRDWHDAAVARLFRTVKLGSSHTHALLARMARFVPRHGHLVRKLTLDLAFSRHAGHRGYVDYTTDAAHQTLSTALATVVRGLPRLDTVAFVFHGRREDVPMAAYSGLMAALAGLRRWHTLSIAGPHALGDLPLAEALLACAAPRVACLSIQSPHSMASLATVLAHRPLPKLQRFSLTLWRDDGSTLTRSAPLVQTIQGISVCIKCAEDDAAAPFSDISFSRTAPGGLELAERSVKPMEIM
ncbi:hypothetical protein AURDEDRAFT_115751 [Auricularia subglabra TFB-10046 SS5]|uniref:F-box domain-containing protein n=1 Tax=Auricularia subglabra (strain TFB-10046 / SS5) TaxID=717982 RepID=J0WWT8_AURST|nr:hypothetical protein AURDEDRAFT_115751 [Auricularia subglabra TFB-10046 SS5]